MFANLELPFPAWELSFHAGPLPGEPAGASFAEIDGVRLHFLDQGSGPAVVFLHGLGASLEMWRSTLEDVAAHHRVLAVDLKGFGWSARPPGDYSHEAQARLVWKLLEARRVQKASLVGHSWGSAVALAMALAAPDRVRCLALYSAWVYQEQLPPLMPWMLTGGLGESLFSLCYPSTPRYRLSLAFHDSRFVTAELVDQFEQELRRPGSAAAALASLRAMNFAPQENRYFRLRIPALLLWGRDDVLAPPSVGERLRGDLGGRSVVYPRCGHFPMIEAARASNRDLQDFLAEAP